jgi:hypothetical protein
MSEIIVPATDQSEAAQATLGFTPDCLEAMLQDNTYTIFRYNYYTQTSFLRPVNNPDVLVRYMPYQDTGRGIDTIFWHQGELDDLRGRGLSVPVHYQALVATDSQTTKLPNAGPYGLCAVVEYIDGEPIPPLSLLKDAKDAIPKGLNRSLVALGAILLGYYTKQRSDTMPLLYDIAPIRQYVQRDNNAVTLIDLDPLPTYMPKDEIRRVSSWASCLKGMRAGLLQRQLKHELSRRQPNGKVHFGDTQQEPEIFTI